jgi:hypothetical protein
VVGEWDRTAERDEMGGNLVQKLLSTSNGLGVQLSETIS